MPRSPLLLAAALFAFPACDTADRVEVRQDAALAKPQPPSSPSGPGDVEAWRTLPDQSELLARDPAETYLAPVSSARGATVIDVDPAQTFQPIVGFGAAVTGSSAYVLSEHLQSTERQQLLDELFDPATGVGFSFARVTLGASDFSLSDYTYDDVPAGQTDPTLAQFSIDPDRAHVLPILQQIAATSADVDFIGSPWSAPAWMKTNGALSGGWLAKEHYGVYAEYLTRTVEAFEAENIPFRAITIQNEPKHGAAYPSMYMTEADQIEFAGDYLGPLFDQRGLDTEIIAYDHNWDVPSYPLDVLSDATASAYVDGSAFHCYAGDVSAMGQVYAAYPDKALYFTECSGGGWSTDFGNNLRWNMINVIIGTTRNGSRSALLWNLALDETSGPTNGGCQDCRGVVTVNSQTGAVTRNVEYYALGHAAKFVRPGAVRIGSTETSGQGLHNVAFQNPDGSLVLIVLNDSNRAQDIQVRAGGQAFPYDVPGGSAVTFRWQ